MIITPGKEEGKVRILCKPDFNQCMLELLLLHTEHKQIKRKLVLPQFYDPAFVHDRDLALNISRF